MSELSKKTVPLTTAALVAACGGQTSATAARTATRVEAALHVPVTHRGDLVETLHGVSVADPYRWLEDLDSDETAAWVAAQNEVTEGFLAAVPERASIRARLEELLDNERYDVPWKEGGRTFYRHNSGLQNQNVLYVVDESGASPRVLLDPNTLSTDGTVSLGQASVSPDGKLLAYALQSSGSDWIEWRVRDVATAADLPDSIRWAKFSDASWARDSLGFYYSAYDAPAAGDEYEDANYFQKLYYHRVGTPQDLDRLVFEDRENKERGFDGQQTLDGRYLVIQVWVGTARENRIYYRDLSGGGDVVRLLDEADGKYAFIGSFGTRFLFRTDLEASRGRVIEIDVAAPARENWREIVPESGETLRRANLVGDHLVCLYLKDAHSMVRVFDRLGAHVRDVSLPGIGTVWGLDGEPDDPETYYSFTGYTTPPTIYRYDADTGASEVYRRPDVPFDPDAYETRQVVYSSKDGTPVRMFLTHKKGLALDGGNPTYLYGYGGFNIPLTPGYSSSMVAWMEMGGVYAVANLRGGGEYGEKWHSAGTKHEKQNVFDDFIAAAEWLIAQGYTSTPKLAIAGGSNGGLLVGACMTQRPDLFGACVPAVGVMDMLRFHKFTIGWAWVSDYGSPDDPDEFATLRAYSPLHNLGPGTCYPPTLVMTSDHDDRVVPSHSFKFAAALQHAQGCDHPCLIRVEVKAGHGAGKPTSKVLDETADRFAFLVRVLEMREP